VAAVAAENRAHKCRSIPYPGECIVICTKCASHTTPFTRVLGRLVSSSSPEVYIWHLLSIYPICTILRQTQYNITPSHAFSSCLRAKPRTNTIIIVCWIHTNERPRQVRVKNRANINRSVFFGGSRIALLIEYGRRAQTMGLRPCAQI
jgi:hypothetical protein